MKAGVIIFIILLVLALIGGFVWMHYSNKKAQEEEQIKKDQAAEQTLSFQENSQVVLPPNSTITSAVYGTAVKNVIVTDLVKSLYTSSPNHQFIASNSTLGGDPVPNTPKTLTIKFIVDQPAA